MECNRCSNNCEVITIVEGEITLLEHNDARWLSPSEIPQYSFCPADKEILEAIMKLNM